MMLQKAASKNKVTPEELIRLKQVIEMTGKKGDREPKDKDQVADHLKVEFKRLKIENKRNPERKN
jgi:hypothetical protein